MLAEKLLKPPSTVVNYIEDVFVSWLSTGNGTSRTVTGPDMTTGGLSITKSRSAATGWHFVDTVRGAGNSLSSNTTAANANESTGVTAFTATGTSIGAAAEYNTNGAIYVDYLLKKQPKFFDVVTYTGDGTAGQTVNHNLGSVPGCIIVKATDAAGHWWVYHTSLGNTQSVTLSTTNAASTSSTFWNNTSPTSTQFTLGNGNTNISGATYVAYLFAHNAGGFGLNGTDNVISCGSYTGNGSATGPVVTLGYEPQWLLVKKTSNATNSNWFIVDNMRGFTADGSDTTLYPNLSNAEGLFNPAIAPTATGFQILNTGSTYNESGSNYIYIAIRRGPMKVPTDGTKVFSPNVFAAAAGTQINTGFPVDMQFLFPRDGGFSTKAIDRLRGVNSTTGTVSTPWLATANTAAETNGANTLSWNNTGFQMPTDWQYNLMSFNNFRRAPSFFDEVCYTGTGLAGQTFNHNLTVPPELWVIKSRSNAYAWYVGSSLMTSSEYLQLNLSDPKATSTTLWNSTYPSSTVITFGYAGGVNASGATYEGLLFASCPGVSKVFIFNGNGSTQTINCGFSGGARFVLLKAMSASGGWYIYDTARGMTTSLDPYLFLNSTAAEVATLGSVTTVATGFAVNESVVTGVNTSGVSYIGFAIA